jgi:SAM-dependent methyltransferase
MNDRTPMGISRGSDHERLYYESQMTQIAKTIRSAAKTVLGPQSIALVRRIRTQLSFASAYRNKLRLRNGLEIGGPSEMLADAGPIPVYDVLASLDNCLYAQTTIWTGTVCEGKSFFFHPKKRPGTQVIAEATDLYPISDSAYQCAIACHCLEHIANPLRALEEWRRVLTDDGLLLLILPHRDGTFDWRRTPTSLDHMIEDYKHEVGEDDLTHLREVLELHDLSLDPGGGTREQLRQRSLSNYFNRTMHHHVFDTMTALKLIDYAGFQILRLDTLKPCHIIILASCVDGTPANYRFIENGQSHWSRSPFPSDHVYANR